MFDRDRFSNLEKDFFELYEFELSQASERKRPASNDMDRRPGKRSNTN